MSVEISGKLVNFEVRRSGTANPFKTMVCTENSTFTITSEISKKLTNCGTKAAPADAQFNASISAVQNANPGALEVSYQDIKAFITGKQKVDFRYASYPDSANGTGYGDGIYNYGSGYFSELGAAASAEAGGLLTYDVKMEGVGTLDNFDTQS